LSKWISCNKGKFLYAYQCEISVCNQNINYTLIAVLKMKKKSYYVTWNLWLIWCWRKLSAQYIDQMIVVRFKLNNSFDWNQFDEMISWTHQYLKGYKGQVINFKSGFICLPQCEMFMAEGLNHNYHTDFCFEKRYLICFWKYLKEVINEGWFTSFSKLYMVQKLN